MSNVKVVRQSVEEEQVDPQLQGSRGFPRSDTVALILILTWGLVFHGIGLDALEYFRHTEADRTLIAWEMITRGDFLVPHLLGSEILTKPPLFYWLLAAVFQMTGEVSEFSARLTSAGAAVLFLLFHYSFLRSARCSLLVSLLGTMVLSTSVLFFILASLAEIDLIYGLFCSLALYASYLGTVSDQKRWMFIAYTAVALAFLTKGPPIVVLFGVPHVLFFALKHRAEKVQWVKFIRWNVAAALLALALVGGWLYLLAGEVGWQALATQFRVEILERIVSESSRSRGPFFYLRSCFSVLGHWSLFLVALAVVLFKEREFARTRWRQMSTEFRDLFCFSAIAYLAAVLLLSFAGGKSNRYLFPVHAALTVLVTLSIYFIRGSKTAEWLVKPFAVAFGFVCAFGLLLVPLVLTVPGVSIGAMYGVALPMALSLGLLGVSARRKNVAGIFICVALTVFGVRLGQTHIFAPHRNVKKTVKPAVATIDQQLAPGVPIYTVEMFERWVPYYLMQNGRTVKRITPSLAQELAEKGGRVSLLLNEKEEAWRIAQLRPSDPDLQLLARVNQETRPLLLVDVAAKQLPLLNPRLLFPTTPSKPPKNLALGYE